MQLSFWTYEGPAHVGAMRIAASLRGVHYVLHAPQGDTYADLLFTMIERHDRRPPVTYTTFAQRDLGGDTADLFRAALHDTVARHAPDLVLVGASCTGELIQDDPAGLSRGIGVPVVPLELSSAQRKENYGAAETFYRVLRHCAAGTRAPRENRRPRANILGPTSLGFRHRDDLVEVRALLDAIGVETGVVAPLGAGVADLARLGEADLNVVLYPEVAEPAARYLEKTFAQPWTRTIPIGAAGVREFAAEVAQLAGLPAPTIPEPRAGWYARSIDSTYFTGKRAFVFGDATHAIAAARVVADELGFTLAGVGTYSREQARAVREFAAARGLDALITDDMLAVERAITDLAPDLVLGTQMERHICKRLGIPAAVIAAPVHVQDFPARHSPQMGIEGANVLFDTWVHPLMMGLEEHLLAMFRDDPEFTPEPSHLPAAPAADATLAWDAEAERALRRVPFFVRGKARRNTETYARAQGRDAVDLALLLDARAHVGS